MTKTTMSTNFFETFEIFTKLAVDAVGEDLTILAVDNVSLSIEEPSRDLVLSRILNNGDDTFQLFRCEFTGSNFLIPPLSQPSIAI